MVEYVLDRPSYRGGGLVINIPIIRCKNDELLVLQRRIHFFRHFTCSRRPVRQIHEFRTRALGPIPKSPLLTNQRWKSAIPLHSRLFLATAHKTQTLWLDRAGFGTGLTLDLMIALRQHCVLWRLKKNSSCSGAICKRCLDPRQ